MLPRQRRRGAHLPVTGLASVRGYTTKSVTRSQCVARATSYIQTRWAKADPLRRIAHSLTKFSPNGQTSEMWEESP